MIFFKLRSENFLKIKIDRQSRLITKPRNVRTSFWVIPLPSTNFQASDSVPRQSLAQLGFRQSELYRPARRCCGRRGQTRGRRWPPRRGRIRLALLQSALQNLPALHKQQPRKTFRISNQFYFHTPPLAHISFLYYGHILCIIIPTPIV